MSKFKLAIDNIAWPVRYDDYGQMIFDNENNLILDIRGWGVLQYLENGKEIQNNIGEFVATFMNIHSNQDIKVATIESDNTGNAGIAAAIAKMTSLVDVIIIDKGPQDDDRKIGFIDNPPTPIVPVPLKDFDPTASNKKFYHHFKGKRRNKPS